MAAAHTHGQRHDRIGTSPGNGELDTPPARRAADTPATLSQKMLSAVSGSIFTSLLVTPLDVVRVRLQAQQGPSPSARLPSFLHLPPTLGSTSCCREVFWVQNQSQFCVANAPSPSASAVMDERIFSDCAAEESQRRTFNTTLDGLRKIARNEGVWTLWRGLSPTLMMAVPGNVIYFAGYDWLRTSQYSPLVGRVSEQYQPLVGGSVARVLAAIVVSPIDMLRTRMQASQNGNKGVLGSTAVAMKEMVGNEGITSLWRGLTLTFWRDVPFSAFYWWGYEYGRKRLDESRARSAAMLGQRHDAELSHSALLTDSFIAGAASGAVASFFTTPFDVGKTRQQTVMHDAQARMKDLPETRSMPRFLWHIYCNEGMNGLFKGWAARCLKVAPACAIMISSYEIGKRMAGSVNDRRELERQDALDA
ncbi:Carrier protein, mitochondrial [Friedmanniomyces endolithicus]|nr:Carrier protein, mitochondrial [Friedmanniomyces endolithicus]KAK0857062.1 Carrier protein, mitochondrial [Friedmanniomyces endolithicus]KAK0868935.1 Carrier protein, mitochondrial [Friedmanniomyces endolithicus]KAK0941751.1 Carrier protein, mitochondrial [Friedmanniomyces endolithicus]KAK1046800.1 Carrier protein, mitochondrial [Friedmanniomyces endolithicus]